MGLIALGRAAGRVFVRPVALETQGLIPRHTGVGGVSLLQTRRGPRRPQTLTDGLAAHAEVGH